MMTWRGHRCPVNLTVQLVAGQLLTDEDAALVQTFFGPNCVRSSLDNEEVAVVWLAYRPPLTRKTRSLVSVHYGRIMDDDAPEGLDLKVARHILGVKNPIVEATRSANGETWLVGKCSVDDFARNL
jgi:hypothetical protein